MPPWRAVLHVPYCPYRRGALLAGLDWKVWGASQHTLQLNRRLLPAGADSLRFELSLGRLTVDRLQLIQRQGRRIVGTQARKASSAATRLHVHAEKREPRMVSFSLLACVSTLASSALAAPSADLVTSMPGFEMPTHFKVYSGYLEVPGP